MKTTRGVDNLTGLRTNFGGINTTSLILGGVVLGAVGFLYTAKGAVYRNRILSTVKGWVNQIPESYINFIPEKLGLKGSTKSSGIDSPVSNTSTSRSGRFAHSAQY